MWKAQHHQEDNTSFSSFESEKQPCQHHNLDTAFFSAFTDSNVNTQKNEFQNHKLSPEHFQTYMVNELNAKLMLLQEENNTLKRQNELLKRQNQLYKKNNTSLKKENSQLLYKLKSEENYDHEHREKYIELVGEVKKLKDSLKQTKKQTQIKEKSTQKLKRQLRNQQQENEWRDSFVELFLDMMTKISAEIKEDWTERKKLQIGWKMAKNIIKRALSSGIQLPKVLKASTNTTYLSEYNKNF